MCHFTKILRSCISWSSYLHYSFQLNIKMPKLVHHHTSTTHFFYFSKFACSLESSGQILLPIRKLEEYLFVLLFLLNLFHFQATYSHLNKYFCLPYTNSYPIFKSGVISHAWA